jgi:CubicO group peptidase (beta-lactamase class C family)
MPRVLVEVCDYLLKFIAFPRGKMAPNFFVLLLVALGWGATTVHAQLQCPPLGPVLPVSETPSRDAGVQQAIVAGKALLQNLTSGFNDTALSLGIRSIHEPSPMFTFHHTPTEFNHSGTHSVNGDTIYRIASASKLFTALSVLQLEKKIQLSDPITKYIPRLSTMASSHDPLTSVDWNSVTIEDLMSHLGGIGADRKSLSLIRVRLTTDSTA